MNTDLDNNVQSDSKNSNTQLPVEKEEFLNTGSDSEDSHNSDNEKNDTQEQYSNIKSSIEKKNLQEVLDESKLKTEEELIKLGQQLKEKEHEEKELNDKLEANLKIIQKYKDHDSINLVADFIKNKKYIELKELIDVLITHESIVNKKLIDKNKNIDKLESQLDDALQDYKDSMEENNELEDKIEKYWEPRVMKLREKLIERKKYINKIYIASFFTIFHTFILTKYGIYSYFNFWVNFFTFIYKIIYFMIFFLPNTYKLITNPKNYHIIYDNILVCSNDYFVYITNLFLIMFKKLFLFIFQSNTFLGLCIVTLITLKIYNKYF